MSTIFDTLLLVAQTQLKSINKGNENVQSQLQDQNQTFCLAPQLQLEMQQLQNFVDVQSSAIPYSPLNVEQQLSQFTDTQVLQVYFNSLIQQNWLDQFLQQFHKNSFTYIAGVDQSNELLNNNCKQQNLQVRQDSFDNTIQMLNLSNDYSPKTQKSNFISNSQEVAFTQISNKQFDQSDSSKYSLVNKAQVIDNQKRSKPTKDSLKYQNLTGVQKNKYITNRFKGQDIQNIQQASVNSQGRSNCGTSQYRGVSWHSQTGRWKAQIKVYGKDINLGRHRCETDAAKAYDKAAICARGAGEARLNFPIDIYTADVVKLQQIPLDQLASELRGVRQRLLAQTSQFHGVRLNKRTQKWEAYIRVAGKHIHLGCYEDESNAAMAYDQAAILRHIHNLGAMGGKPQITTNFNLQTYKAIIKDLTYIKDDQMLYSVAKKFDKLMEKYSKNVLQKCVELGGVFNTLQCLELLT